MTEYLTEHPLGRGPVPRQRVHAAVDRTLEVCAGYEPGDPSATGIRNHLALALTRCGRWEEALRQFELIGTDVRELPWAYVDGENEVRGFADERENTRVQVAKAVPFFSRLPPRGLAPCGSCGSCASCTSCASCAGRPAGVPRRPP
ncbi:hypothetical protein OG946_32295 [Streptomyces sp. NBC_01808]|uniref:hypothetical protein n=1 Tax=Streptomyces sp. NBC_01808 TaxID=2975947 RepID=UPI002DDB8E43|nr:hypothetical protein [Streptomyces sp. NBC_01808]WSA41641.1 hypothetical protein OG946_32295 [Streptomyces sp. NBC_01808]